MHVDVLGWLHFIWGVLGVLVGASLLILALGTNTALRELGTTGPAEHAAVWLFVICGLTLVAAGVVMMIVARALGKRRPWGRLAALVLAVPNLVVVPFGTALGIYAFWVLLHNETRAVFVRA
jgi:hypothetical protein